VEERSQRRGSRRIIPIALNIEEGITAWKRNNRFHSSWDGDRQLRRNKLGREKEDTLFAEINSRGREKEN